MNIESEFLGRKRIKEADRGAEEDDALAKEHVGGVELLEARLSGRRPGCCQPGRVPPNGVRPSGRCCHRCTDGHCPWRHPPASGGAGGEESGRWSGGSAGKRWERRHGCCHGFHFLARGGGLSAAASVILELGAEWRGFLSEGGLGGQKLDGDGPQNRIREDPPSNTAAWPRNGSDGSVCPRLHLSSNAAARLS